MNHKESSCLHYCCCCFTAFAARRRGVLLAVIEIAVSFDQEARKVPDSGGYRGGQGGHAPLEAHVR